MAGMELPERLPVHPFGFVACTVQYARLPTQPIAQLVGSPDGSIVRGFPLALAGQLVTMPTSKHAAAVQHRYPPTTARARARPPGPLPTIAAAVSTISRSVRTSPSRA